MFQIIKRDGKVVEFDLSKISGAIEKAFIAQKREYNNQIIDMLALNAVSDAEKKAEGGKVDVESIQDSVEATLQRMGYEDVAKAYILYRNQREKIRNMNSALLNYKNLVDSYVKVEDWRVKENSTVTYSVGGLILSNSGAITANYWLSEIYDKEIADAHRNADIHIHDLSMLTGYCAGWSLKQLIQEGLGGIVGKITSAPAKHLSTLCNQMVNFLGIMQNEWAGAQAFSSFDTYLAPFVKVDNLSYKQVKQDIQSFIYGVNTPSRWGTQSPFTNIQYPIPTYSITRDFDWSETENNKLLFEMAAKYGIPYFSNYINSDMEPSDVRSMCCRLRLDLRELRKKSGGFFGSGESTGSVGVVTINIPRIAYLAENEEDFYKRLDHLMDIAARSLKIKRNTITKLLDEGLYPYTRHYLGTFNNHFSTIGLVGMNEAGLNAKWLRKDLTHEETQAFAADVLNHMRNKLSEYQEKYGDLYNLEATPAESTAFRLAKHDKARYPDIITANDASGVYYYTNSSHLPVGYTTDIFDALDVQDNLQTLYTSGTVFHAFLGERLPDWKAAASLVRKIAENYRLEVKACPECGGPTETYSRITGYYRPVKNWNDGKLQEFKDRKTYNTCESTMKPRTATVTVTKAEEKELPELKPAPDAVGTKPMLFTTHTCAKCKAVKAMFDEQRFDYELIYADDDAELAKQFDIVNVPVLIIPDGDGVRKYTDVGPIRQYVNECKGIKS